MRQSNSFEVPEGAGLVRGGTCISRVEPRRLGVKAIFLQLQVSARLDSLQIPCCHSQEHGQDLL